MSSSCPCQPSESQGQGGLRHPYPPPQEDFPRPPGTRQGLGHDLCPLELRCSKLRLGGEWRAMNLGTTSEKAAQGQGSREVCWPRCWDLLPPCWELLLLESSLLPPGGRGLGGGGPAGTSEQEEDLGAPGPQDHRMVERPARLPRPRPSRLRLLGAEANWGSPDSVNEGPGETDGRGQDCPVVQEASLGTRRCLAATRSRGCTTFQVLPTPLNYSLST